MKNKKNILIISYVIIISTITILSSPSPLFAEKTITTSQLQDKLYGMWISQIIGNMAGRPSEGDFCSIPNPDPCVPWVIRPPEPIEPNQPYYWDADAKQWLNPVTDNTTSEEVLQLRKWEGYAVYNYTSQPLTLRIPAVEYETQIPMPPAKIPMASIF